MLASLLPERVGSPLSLNGLREDLEVSYNTVKRWLDSLHLLYYTFPVRPYHRSITRALKKEAKIYLWDYTDIPDRAARFENLVACHLLKACHYWTDRGEGRFELWYLRNKQKEEIDFLITRDQKPWLPVEAKLNETALSPHWKKFMPQLTCDHGVQVVARADTRKVHSLDTATVTVASASDILYCLV
jgi:predicted AAA+ superfamily ATPase